MYEQLQSYFLPSSLCSIFEIYRNVKLENNETCSISNSLDSFYHNFSENIKHCNNTTLMHEPTQQSFQIHNMDDSSSYNDDNLMCLKQSIMSPYVESKNISDDWNGTYIPVTVFPNSDECYCDYKESKQINKTIQCLCHLNKVNATINGTDKEDECRSIRRNCIMFNKTEEPDDVFYNCTIQNTSFSFEPIYFNESGKGYLNAQCSPVNSVNDSFTVTKSLFLFILFFHLIMNFLLVKKEHVNIKKKKKEKL